MDYVSPEAPEYQLVVCPRSHSDLKHRNSDIPLDDLPLGMYNAYKDAVERGCGHDKVAQYKRLEVRMENSTVTDLPEEATTGPADETTGQVKAVAKTRKPKTCSECGQGGHNKRTHGRQGQPGYGYVKPEGETPSA